MAYEADGGVVWDRPDDELSGQPVVERRVKLVLKLSDVRAARDSSEDKTKDKARGETRDRAEDIERDIREDAARDIAQDPS